MAILTAQPTELPAAVRRGNGARPVLHLTPAERAARGRLARTAVPRSEHARLDLPPNRPDPVVLLEEQALTRVPELVPIRYGRMSVSPFTFFRGAALVMAADLAATPVSGLQVQLCGDAHVANFGGFASPERSLVFDINDFDETWPGPFEWDVKRLAASLSVAGRDQGYSTADRRSIVVETVREYREAMRAFAGQRNLDVWYARLDVIGLLNTLSKSLDRKRVRRMEGALAKARTKDSMQAMRKLTRLVDGEPRITSDPPLIVPLTDLLPDAERADVEAELRQVLRHYRRTLPGDRRHLLEQFRLVDVARKVVGVGSVGTRCWIALLLGRDGDDPLFLQFKEAEASVLARFTRTGRATNHGQRVVEGQRIMQATGDIFLGWDRVVNGMDGRSHDYYVRQLWDWKISAALEGLAPALMKQYGRVCGWTLARAHARAGDRIAVAAYLGSGYQFDLALADFAESYADQNERDYAALIEAISSGRLVAQQGI
jgi:uncharacterized protein (DUF2252 family)